MARMISELGKSADIMASADFTVIDKALIPAHADWNIRFATNQPGLYDRLIANRPEKSVRPKSVELVSMLKAGKPD